MSSEDAKGILAELSKSGIRLKGRNHGLYDLQDSSYLECGSIDPFLTDRGSRSCDKHRMITFLNTNLARPRWFCYLSRTEFFKIWFFLSTTNLWSRAPKKAACSFSFAIFSGFRGATFVRPMIILREWEKLLQVDGRYTPPLGFGRRLRKHVIMETKRAWGFLWN